MADKKAVRARMDELLAQGVGKTEVFRQLATTDIKPRVLAGWLAATPDMSARQAMSLHITILCGLMVAQALIVFIVLLSVSLFLALVIAMIPLLFAWGFRKPAAGAYSGYILLSIISIAQNAAKFRGIDTPTVIGLAIGIATIGYVAWIQWRVFPDMTFTGPNRKSGEYVFKT